MGSNKVGFIGLGNIGGPMCGRLLAAGYQVIAYDTRPEALAGQVAKGAQAATSPADVARQTDLILLSLPDDRVVASVLFDAGGVVETAAPGTLVIDLSTSRPLATRETAARLAQHGIRMLDAPVSGGVPRAIDGTLVIIVGGDAADLERSRDVLSCLGSKIVHVGDIGAGHIAKAINNLISAATMWITSEAVAAGVKAGVDASRLIEVINGGSGRSNSSEVKFPRYILNRQFNAGFAVRLMVKDLSIATELAEAVGAPLPVGALIHQLWNVANQRWAEEDHTVIARLVEELAGVQLGETPHS